MLSSLHLFTDSRNRVFPFFQQLCSREMKKIRLPCPSTSYASLTSQIPNFGEKSCKCFIQGQLLSVVILSLLSAMYWKSSKVRIFWISLQIYLRELFPSDSYVLEMEETDIFSVFPKKTFPLPLITTGENGIMLSSISYSFLNLQIPNIREYSRNIFLLGAIAFSRYLFPSGSYVFERGENPKFRSFSPKNKSSNKSYS